MGEICCGFGSDNRKNNNDKGNDNDSISVSSTSPCDARRRRMEIRRFRFIAGVSTSTIDNTNNSNSNNNNDNNDQGIIKRQRMDKLPQVKKFSNSSNNSNINNNRKSNCNKSNNGCSNSNNSSSSNSGSNGNKNHIVSKRVRYKVYNMEDGKNDSFPKKKILTRNTSTDKSRRSLTSFLCMGKPKDAVPNFGIASVCGRRRDMEDAVSVHPYLLRSESSVAMESHYFAVYDGHGCSHVAMKCRERLHELVKEEVVLGVGEWKVALERSFKRMDKEAVTCDEGVIGNCRCELRTPECDAVGSTAVVAIVTPANIIVANCGDSRAVLCRNGKAFPLSMDHKPDRPDELNRIQEAGGRVIYWDGPRVLGMLAMSRAIGDNYLKPYVSSEPEITITTRSPDDECLILASDGLWDVMTNDTACGVARMCLRGKVPPPTLTHEIELITGVDEGMADKACSNASTLLTKLALARHSTDNVSVVVIDLRKDNNA